MSIVLCFSTPKMSKVGVTFGKEKKEFSSKLDLFSTDIRASIVKQVTNATVNGGGWLLAMSYYSRCMVISFWRSSSKASHCCFIVVTTCTMIFTHAIFVEGCKSFGAGMNSMIFCHDTKLVVHTVVLLVYLILAHHIGRNHTGYTKMVILRRIFEPQSWSVWRFTREFSCHRRIIEDNCPPYPCRKRFVDDFVYSRVKDIPNARDWFDSGDVTRVMNQKIYGICYAMATTSAIESTEKLFGSGDLPKLSVQELIDHKKCGCGIYGGSPACCFNYVIARRGLTYEKDYPLIGFNPRVPITEKMSRSGDIFKYNQIPPNDIDAFLKVLAHRPVVCSMRTSRDFLNFKGQSIFKKQFESEELEERVHARAKKLFPKITSKEILFDVMYRVREQLLMESINHIILAVGYSIKDNYIRFKNSWGTAWADKGLIKIDIDTAASYGIYEDVMFPIHQNEVRLCGRS